MRRQHAVKGSYQGIAGSSPILHLRQMKHRPHPSPNDPGEVLMSDCIPPFVQLVEELPTLDIACINCHEIRPEIKSEPSEISPQIVRVRITPVEPAVEQELQTYRRSEDR